MKLGRIAHDELLIESGFIQGSANRANTSIHHVGWGNDVSAGAGLDKGLLDQDGDGFVVEDIAVLVEQPVMAVAGEGIERDIASYADFRCCGLHRLDDCRDEPFQVDGFVAAVILLRGVDMRENRNRRDAEFAGADGGLGGFIDIQAVDARHRLHRDARFLAVMDDHAPDNIVRAGFCFPHKPPGPVMLTNATEAGARKGAGDQRLGHGAFLLAPLGSGRSAESHEWERMALSAALDGTLNTFNVRFAESDYDETWAAVAVAEHIGSNHHTLNVDNAQGSWDYVTDMLNHAGQPFADTSMFAVDSVSKLMRQHVTVALSGDGGDEGYGGYKAYGRVSSLSQFQRMPTWMWQNTGKIASMGLSVAAQIGVAPQHLSARMRDIAVSNDSTYLVQKMFCVLPEEEHRLLCRDIDVDPIRRLFEPQWTNRAYASPAEQLSAQIAETNLRVEMPNAFLFKTDIASMHRSLEIRVPMLDEDMFQFGLSLRHHLKVNHGQTKAVLRRVAARKLPAKVAQKPKHGFAIPVDTWVNADFKTQLRETLLGTNSNLPRFFSPESYKPIIEAFVEGRPYPGVARSLLYRRAIMLLSVHLAAAA